MDDDNYQTIEDSAAIAETDGNAIAMEPTTLNVAQCTDLLIGELYQSEQVYMLRRFLSNILSRHGWSSSLRHKVVDYIKKNGPNNVNVSHMWSDLADEGLETTPNEVRLEVKNYLRQFGQTYIELDDTIQITEELGEDEKLYEMQSRDAVPEPPSGLYPPPSPNFELAKYVKPPWLFVYDKPKPLHQNATTNSTPVTNGSETGESDNYESSGSPSSPCSNTPPENYNDEMGGDEDDDDSPGSLDSREESRKNPIRPLQQGDRDRERKRRAAKQRQQMERAGANSDRVVKPADENRKSKASVARMMNLGSPQLTIPLRQLKIDKKSGESQPGSSNTSKLSPNPQQPPPPTHKKGSTASKLVDDEEEEELMDV